MICLVCFVLNCIQSNTHKLEVYVKVEDFWTCVDILMYRLVQRIMTFQIEILTIRAY